MEEFVKELEQLPIERQKAIKEGLQKQILAQAVFVRDEQPTKFLAYIDDEIGKADASMFKMVQESSREGAVLGSISEIYIWNKERKRVLIGLKQEYMDITQADIEKQHPEPQPNSKKGRPKKSFKDCLNGNQTEKDERLSKLHNVIDGKKGKCVSLYILTAIELGWIEKPTYTQVKNEFGDIGNKSGYNSYLQRNKFSDAEINGAKESLK